MDIGVVTWIGGKHYIADWICKKLDYRCLTYLEIFGGSGSVLFSKVPHEVEIFNDMNGDLVNFFKVVREKPEQLRDALSLMPYSRELFNELQGKFVGRQLSLDKEFGELDNFQRAVEWFYVLSASFSAKMGHGWGYSYIGNQAKSFFNKLDKFTQIATRLRNVQIDCRDYREIFGSIKERMARELMIYVDPPYVGTNYYKHCNVWGIEEHKELAKWLNRLSDWGAKIALSYYDFPELSEWYNSDRWSIHSTDIVKYSRGTTMSDDIQTRPIATELLLCNYNEQTVLDL